MNTDLLHDSKNDHDGRERAPAPEDTAPRLLRGRLLRGANVHHTATVFVQRVQPGAPAALRDCVAEDFAARFAARFDGASVTPEQSFPEALLAAIVAVERRAAREQGRIDEPGFARAVPSGADGDGAVDLVWTSDSASKSRAAARTALAGLLDLLGLQGPLAPAAAGGAGPDSFEESLAQLLQRCRRRHWSAATAFLELAARRRGLGHEVLAGSYVRLGEGAVQRLASASGGGDLDATPPDRRGEVAEALLATFVPPQQVLRIPTALVLGDRDARRAARAADRLLRTVQAGVGLAVRERATIDGKPIDPTARGRHSGPRFLLGDPRVTLLVAAETPERLVARGAGLDRFSVVALLAAPPGGDDDRRALAALIDSSPDVIVAGADDPHLPFLLGAVDRGRLLVVARRSRHRAAAAHEAAGGSIVVQARDRSGFELRRGAVTVAAIAAVPLLRGEEALGGRRLRSALVGAGIAFALGAGWPRGVSVGGAGAPL